MSLLRIKLTLLLLVLQQQQFTQAATVSAVVIPTDGEVGVCPVKEKRNDSEAIQNITAEIKEIITVKYSNVAFASNCGEGLWYRVAYLNMSNSSQQCPSAWREYNSSGIRACARPTSRDCPGKIYNVNHQYSRVCGRVIGYQIGSPNAFDGPDTVDNAYLDGVSITRGLPRVHIWSYVAGVSEQGNCAGNNILYKCPCSGGEAPPSFVGNNFYCESAYQGPNCFRSGTLGFPNDPLWDGQQCNNEGTCCTGDGVNTPPWFSVTLSNTTSDDIEVRICHDQGINNEDTPISLLEIFVQ